jgi:protein HOOK3
VNTFPLDSKVESVIELSDGFVFSKMLGRSFVFPLLHDHGLTLIAAEDFEPIYAVHVENHTSPSKWLAKKKSLEAVYKSLVRFIQNHCADYVETTLRDPVDVNAIAEHDDEEETVKVALRINETQLDDDLTDLCVQLIKIFLMAATRNGTPQKYVDRILKLTADDQSRIAAICKEQEVNDENSSVLMQLTCY